MLIGLGVTGGIGAYKAVEVARGLQKRGHDVVGDHDAVGAEVRRRGDVRGDHAAAGDHRSVRARAPTPTSSTSRSPPTSACCSSRRRRPTLIGKLANGIADDFLTSLYLATRAPVLLAPAMNTNMLEHPAVQRNLQTLASRGVRFVDPGEGFLACGWIGKGRLAEPEAIVEAAEADAAAGRLAARPARRRLGRSDLRGHRSRPLHRQSLERAHGLRDRG